MRRPYEDDETQDAKKEAVRQGFRDDDFRFERTDSSHIGIEPAAVFYEVTAIHEQSGAERTFEAGHGYAWVSAFVDALKAGAFGTADTR